MLTVSINIVELWNGDQLRYDQRDDDKWNKKTGGIHRWSTT